MNLIRFRLMLRHCSLFAARGLSVVLLFSSVGEHQPKDVTGSLYRDTVNVAEKVSDTNGVVHGDLREF